MMWKLDYTTSLAMVGEMVVGLIVRFFSPDHKFRVELQLYLIYIPNRNNENVLPFITDAFPKDIFHWL